MDAGAVVRTYWESAELRDWDRFATTLHDHVVYLSPQSGERVQGKEAYLRFNQEGFTDDWHLSIQRVVAGDGQAATWIEMHRGDGRVQHGVCFFDLDRGGRITGITDFWPDPYEVPTDRQQLVERY